MKKVLLPVCAGILLLASCKENDPAIDFGRRAADSTYLLTGAELSGLTTDAHQALVGEIQGHVTQQMDRLEQVVDHDRFEDVEFKVAL